MPTDNSLSHDDVDLAAEVDALRTKLAAAERSKSALVAKVKRLADRLAIARGALPDRDVRRGWADAVARADEAEAAVAERDELRIAIHGCQCPAPWTECPHDEPLLPALNRATAELAALRAVIEAVADALDHVGDGFAHQRLAAALDALGTDGDDDDE